MRYGLPVGVCVAAMLAAPFAAGAADLPIVPPAAAAPLWSWTGLYAGFHVANGWANDTWATGSGLLGAAAPFIGVGSGNGAVGGAQVGWNYQTGPWVFGAEGAFGLADINTLTACGRAFFVCTTNIDGLGTLTGRIGFASDQFLIYGKGGAAAERAHSAMVPYPGFGITNVFNGSTTRWGWTAGAGLEFALSPALSAFAEYDYIDFGTRAVALVDQNGITAGVNALEAVHLVKLGLNYKLGQGAVPWAMTFAALPPVAPPPSGWSWTGVYVGGQVGGGWGQTNWNSATGFLSTVSNVAFAGSGTAYGFAIGGQVGANYQFGPWVTGLEADANWSDLDSNAICARFQPALAFLAPSGFTCHTRIDALGTLTGRLGLTFGNLLVYGKGGAAWDSEQHQANVGFANPREIFSGDDTRWGWTLGLGLEYAFTPAWSGRIEYDYINFANTTVALNDGLGNTSNVGLSQSLNVVKMGFNYKIGADPLAPAYGASPAPIWVKAPIFKAPPSDWTIEAGTRYWLSSGRKQLDLNEPFPPTQIASRLIYDNVVGQAAEGFARLDHRDGMFVKGNFGLGDLSQGRWHDEDFPPGFVPYSLQQAGQGDGRMLYGSLDLGHVLVRGPGGDLGAYAGYRYFFERENDFGSQQQATFANSFLPGPTVLNISETEAWSGAAVGLNGRAQLADRWRLEVDAALLPFVGMWGFDNHWRRGDISPGTEQGHGWGAQFEAIITYALTDQWSLGAGGRYWYFATTQAHTQFPGLTDSSPLKFYSERYGGFVQATYKFDGGGGRAAAASNLYTAPHAPVTWTGFYAGGHLGAGFGRSSWSDPFGPTPIGDQDLVGGALVGGQVGANYQTGVVVYGVEAAGSWADLNGTASCFVGNPNQGINGQECGTRVGALAFVTGRIGYANDRTLYYAKAGPAWGHSAFSLNFSGAAPGQIAEATANRWGWTIGGGVEQALTREWSIVAEYKYVDLGSASIGFPTTPAVIAQVASEAINQRYQLLTLGMNYKFY
jgi:opacity protein-like surface antigen